LLYQVFNVNIIRGSAIIAHVISVLNVNIIRGSAIIAHVISSV